MKLGIETAARDAIDRSVSHHDSWQVGYSPDDADAQERSFPALRLIPDTCSGAEVSLWKSSTGMALHI